MKVPNLDNRIEKRTVSLSRLQNEGSQRDAVYKLLAVKSIKATE